MKCEKCIYGNLNLFVCVCKRGLLELSEKHTWIKVKECKDFVDKEWHRV